MTRHGTLLLAMVSRRTNGAQHAVIVDWSIGIITAAVGVSGVVLNNRLPHNGGSESLLPVAFGLCLAVFVLLRFYRHVRYAAIPASNSLLALSRELTRLNYLAIYLLIGANETVAVLNKSDLEASAGRLRGYLVAAIIAFTLIRVLALLVKGSSGSDPVSLIVKTE